MNIFNVIRFLFEINDDLTSYSNVEDFNKSEINKQLYHELKLLNI